MHSKREASRCCSGRCIFLVSVVCSFVHGCTSVHHAHARTLNSLFFPRGKKTGNQDKPRKCTNLPECSCAVEFWPCSQAILFRAFPDCPLWLVHVYTKTHTFYARVHARRFLGQITRTCCMVGCTAGGRRAEYERETDRFVLVAFPMDERGAAVSFRLFGSAVFPSAVVTRSPFRNLSSSSIFSAS